MTADADAEIVVRQVTEGVHTISRPFWRWGWFPFGGRSTIVTLQNGSLWILASTPLTPLTKQTLDSLGGRVAYLVAPDAEHSLFLSQWAKSYPDAKVIGVPPLVPKRRGEVTFHGVYGLEEHSKPPFGYEDEIDACYFSGFANKDVAFLHKKSKTLIQADLLFNFPPKEQFERLAPGSEGWLRFLGIKGGKVPCLSEWFSPWENGHKWFLWAASQDKAAMARDAKTVAGWDFNRIVPCHGDVIEEKGKEAFLEAYKWHLEQAEKQKSD
ncbi:uncharacterized protein EI90DRAFT_3146910 [Cantharellus anzutake]|uniref:uncharacterized protein n=1 Tax=Cantharellus anzutake TaxID=1750568 RepID=UPI001903A413|nr:uncharacterized protein EI90DRAFT_3146910 [Cantharellus anzutake]KAF8324308.1 hypothetical protein EI90DRAFT_3146910 [Cantharellus anzutake]